MKVSSKQKTHHSHQTKVDKEEIQEEAANNNNQDLIQLNRETHSKTTIIGIRIIENSK